MSALAARRAAQAAKLANGATVAPSAPVEAVKPAASPTPSIPSSLDMSDLESEAGPSKRRRPARYFAAPQDPQLEQASGPKSKRARRFSPSAPASDAEDGDDSSDAESSSAEQEVDEGRADWTVPSTPHLNGTATPKRTAIAPAGSRFKPVTGVNYRPLSAGDLDECGVGGAGDGVIISLGKQDSLMLAGMYSIIPLQGSLDILSTTISPSAASMPIPVIAPSSHPIPVITRSEAGTSDSRPSALLAKLRLPLTFQLAESRSVFLVREHESGMQGLKGGIVPGFSTIWGDDRGAWGLRSVHPVLGSASSTMYPHITPDSWLEPLRHLSSVRDRAEAEDDDDEDESPIALVKGPKRSGKSTFARAALNSLLRRYEKVAWLECDLGQGEFSPGGVVGLWIIDQPVFGPPFTHPRIPHRAHYLGSFTPQTCADEYIAAITQLLTYYRYEVAHPLLSSSVVPLVINTQGWVKGLGEELLRVIEMAAEPTHTFAFESEFEDTSAVPTAAGWTSSPPTTLSALPTTTGSKSYTLQSAPVSPLLARHTPSDLRTLAMIAYFYAHLDTRVSDSATWDFGRPLLAMPPWQVLLSAESTSAGIRQVVMLGESADSIVSADLALALNGSIVALVEHADQDPAREAVYDPDESPPALDDSTYRGLALVRGLQPDADAEGAYRLHLLTPLPAEVLQRCNVIVRNGAIELPLCGMLDWRYPNASDLAGVKWEDAPFLDVSGVVGVGGERRRFRRNLMRKGQ